jgi:hypothetical protein
MAGIFPAMRGRAFKIKTVARPEPVFLSIERNMQLPAQNK